MSIFLGTLFLLAGLGVAYSMRAGTEPADSMATLRHDYIIKLVTDPALLALNLKEAEQAHGEYEKKLGHRDDNWADWYAQYMANMYRAYL